MRKLLADGVDRVVVWGGDGTVRRCIDTIVEEVPGGAGNFPAGPADLLAHGLGIPIDLEAALEIALLAASCARSMSA